MKIHYLYWGKVKSDSGNDNKVCHLLIYHALDVAAVAARWWDTSPVVQNLLTPPGENKKIIRAWLLFFIALHDIGKFEIRFQAKQLAVWQQLNPQRKGRYPSLEQCRKFPHGPGGLFLFWQDRLKTEEEDAPQYSWVPWLEAVCGHHGFIMPLSEVIAIDQPVESEYAFDLPFSLRCWAGADRLAREAFIAEMAALFLHPVGLTLEDIPPLPGAALAGFCSVSDWLGSWSSEDTFLCCTDILPAADYFNQRYEQDAVKVLARSGVLSQAQRYSGIAALLKENYQPRQLQVLVDSLPASAGLTLIEAPTGSGKTETALAYAWRLIDAGLAESIVFALPTQATANAMLTRLDTLADKFFRQGNLTLAHGAAKFNQQFTGIKSRVSAPLNDEEGWTQCCEWIAQSNKRAFLAQIGVCTVDQVLTAVLPVKHRFIRSFGLTRSVVIIDEVHACDTYMYGLLTAMLEAQYRSGGSAILLSATLPATQKQQLLQSYGAQEPVSSTECYPLVSWQRGAEQHSFDLTAFPEQLPPDFQITLTPYYLADMQPNDALLERMIAAAESGAQVCLICNLVQVAQQVYQRLLEMTQLEVMLFHARYSLTDRAKKERAILDCFGPDGDRRCGRILVATQVIEQSLDVDFDLLLIQLCPVDLLFQRLGRLHRHKRARPVGFEQPQAIVLLPTKADYGHSGLIYANTLVMWRTQGFIEALNGKGLTFPAAYRQWIEPIYQPELTGDEPQWVNEGYDAFLEAMEVSRYSANYMLAQAKTPKLYKDNDQHIRAVTREGEMSLSVMPFIRQAAGRQLLDGRIFESLSDEERSEALAMNRVNVPRSWERYCPQAVEDKEHIWLAGEACAEGWRLVVESGVFTYSETAGMRWHPAGAD